VPELPEVETTKRGIAPVLLGARVLETAVRERRLRWPIAANVEAAVRGQRVKSVERRAKYILIGLDAGTLIVHFGMSGSLRLVKPGIAPRPHDHCDLHLDNGWVLRFHDPRRFGSLHWTAADPREHPLLKKLAPEPLSVDFDAEYLYQRPRSRSGTSSSGCAGTSADRPWRRSDCRERRRDQFGIA
jgi:formamidopyrimidine-DNA glycosylase